MSNIKLRRNARIADNNQLNDAAVIAPADPDFPFSNALDFKNRGKYWRPESKVFTITIDMHANKQSSFFAIFGEADKLLKISNQAIVVLKANMINLFTGGEPFVKQASVTDLGVFCDLTDNDYPTGQQYRYWQIYINDEFSPDDIEVSAIYLGDHIDFQFNAKQQFSFEWTDLTRRAISDAGVVYSIRKNQIKEFSSLGFLFLSQDERKKLLSTMETVGMATPFIFILDPLESAYEFEFATVMAYFNQFPTLTHAYLNKFNMQFSIREVI